MVRKGRYLGQSSEVYFISEVAVAFEVILSALDGPAEVGGEGEEARGREGADLKLLNVLFIVESLPGGKLEDRNSEFQTLFVLGI